MTSYNSLEPKIIQIRLKLMHNIAVSFISFHENNERSYRLWFNCIQH